MPGPRGRPATRWARRSSSRSRTVRGATSRMSMSWTSSKPRGASWSAMRGPTRTAACATSPASPTTPETSSGLCHIRSMPSKRSPAPEPTACPSSAGPRDDPIEQEFLVWGERFLHDRGSRGGMGMSVDTVKAAKKSAKQEQPYTELGLKDDEYARIRELLGRRPTSSELTMYSVMWSEHCSYKSSKIHLRQLAEKAPQTDALLVGIGENAGVVDAGDGWAVTFKIESHNHPSFVEPYQGAATGVGGIVRDILTMGARPVAVMDSLRFGPASAADTHRVLPG